MKEGFILSLPCRRCAAMTLRVRLRNGKETYSCPACGATTLVIISADGERWVIKTGLWTRQDQV